MSGRLSAAHREVFRTLADVWLPAVGDMPSASDAGVVEMLDRILDLRRDALPEIVRGLDAVSGMAPQAALHWLQTSDVVAYTELKLAILGAYYLNADVMDRIGYPGQQSRPVDPEQATDFLEADLLAPVLKRGSIWRRAPG
ncbi:MAG: hypothetical protein ABW034_21645 [Steroidobacteraceae bacterium]